VPVVEPNPQVGCVDLPASDVVTAVSLRRRFAGIELANETVSGRFARRVTISPDADDLSWCKRGDILCN
jgi:hypothetical protein